MEYYVPKDRFIWRVMEAAPGMIGCLIFPLVLVIWLPTVPFTNRRRTQRRKTFHQKMEQQGRVISWTEFLYRANGEEGTIVIEVGNKATSRFWWVRDRLRTISPIQPPKLSEQSINAYGGKDYHPFARWCYEKYLNPEDGKALMAFPVEADFETWPFERDNYEVQMQKRFPRQEIVVLTFYDTRYL
jgi:hypothetical protein